ncbi:hypothetical protein [Alteribacter natronophilus]|uniref:hypothetical protein n=1 Tax=Alteribacter natronophilus TaxID=2583810 RepID=UPI00110F05F9|nr:hypothetical protein [Alteribacter natronophilus]TMW71442.1 hypothetical protein FGB90_10365 [Alteribacter natronophilus]
MTSAQKKWLAAISLLLPALSIFVYPFFTVTESQHRTGFPLRFLTHHGEGLPESRLMLLDPVYFTGHVHINLVEYFFAAGIVWITGFFLINAWNFRKVRRKERSGDPTT